MTLNIFTSRGCSLQGIHGFCSSLGLSFTNRLTVVLLQSPVKLIVALIYTILSCMGLVKLGITLPSKTEN